MSSWHMVSRVDKCEKALMRRPMYGYWVVLEELFGDPHTYRRSELTRHCASLYSQTAYNTMYPERSQRSDVLFDPEKLPQAGGTKVLQQDRTSMSEGRPHARTGACRKQHAAGQENRQSPEPWVDICQNDGHRVSVGTLATQRLERVLPMPEGPLGAY